jgi:hypothetical protein
MMTRSWFKAFQPERPVPFRALPAEAPQEMYTIVPYRKRRHTLNMCLALAVCIVLPAIARAQGNYEVQVYGSDLIPPGQTMVELHSNFTFQGSKDTVDGVRPDIHALHETLEVTQGFTPWLETGFYLFTSYRPGEGLQYVGNHIRPRVRIPEDWNWPVGLSLSTEVGYQRRSYSPDTWTWEIRPIVDKDLGPWYLCFNPTLERSFHGAEVGKGVTFSPNVKIGYAVSKKVNAGVEYYGAVGSITGFDPLRDQQQAIVPVVDLNLSPKWEFNFGVGVGMTSGTDHLLVKMILGRRLQFGRKR